MCIGLPMQIISIDNDTAIAQLDGVRREINLMLLSEEAVIGQFVIVHAGFAICCLNEEHARETLAMLRHLYSAAEGPAA